MQACVMGILCLRTPDPDPRVTWASCAHALYLGNQFSRGRGGPCHHTPSESTEHDIYGKTGAPALLGPQTPSRPDSGLTLAQAWAPAFLSKAWLSCWRPQLPSLRPRLQHTGAKLQSMHEMPLAVWTPFPMAREQEVVFRCRTAHPQPLKYPFFRVMCQQV